MDESPAVDDGRLPLQNAVTDLKNGKTQWTYMITCYI